MGCRAKAGDMIYDENICLLRDGRGGAEFLAVKPTISLKPKKVDRRLPCYLKLKPTASTRAPNGDFEDPEIAERLLRLRSSCEHHEGSML
ncbi:hypothetical protein YC2023_022946 [Brassica napus]